MTSRLRDRRQFVIAMGGLGAACLMRAQEPDRTAGQTTSLAHMNVAELERDRVLHEANAALSAPILPVTATTVAQGSPNRFFSEVQPDIRTAGGVDAPALFRAHARALREFSATVACLSAAFVLTGESKYTARVAEHLRASLLTTKTRMEPSFNTAGCVSGSASGTPVGTPAGIVDLVPLAELARALSFLIDNECLAATEWDAVRIWFASANDWLNTNRAALIARDVKDHRASAWLLIASAFARLARDENALEACRKQFRSPTLRNQIRADGVFPQEVATPNPYRNTLLNFDLLAGACQLLNSPFDPLWNHELVDGVGLRVVAAYLYPVIAHPEHWSFIADAVAFRDLPGRRPGLLFAGRAYDRPEYVAAWQGAPAASSSETVAASFPIREPLLWTARAPHGF